MTASPENEWKIENASHLKGVRLHFRRYTQWSESWDHDHCAACWATFAEFEGLDIQHEGYAAYHLKDACYEWICQACFDDLKGNMEWTADDT